MAILIRVEVASRELVPRLLLGLVCAEAGYDVIVGKLKVDHLKEGRVGRASFRPGLLHLKSPAVTPPLYPTYAELQGSGYRLSAQDEEAGISEAVDVDDFFARRAPREAYEQLDTYLCWGRRDRAGLVRAHPTMDARAKRTGSPRIDMFRAPAAQRNGVTGSESRQRFVLWASSASPLRKTTLFSYEADRLSQWDSPDTARFWHEWREGPSSPTAAELLARQSETFTFFARVVESIEALAAAAPKTQIVIRPHHKEDSSAWRLTTSHLPNVTVETAGEISEWIASASLVIHTMSTVGLQARLLGVPTINFVGLGGKGRPMSRSGVRVDSPETLLGAALPILSSEERGVISGAEAHSSLAEHFDALDGELASERILRVWENVFDRDLMSDPIALKRERSKFALRRRTEGARLRHEGEPFPNLAGKSFPALESSDWRQLHDYLKARFGRFSNVQMTPLGPFDALLSSRNPAG